MRCAINIKTGDYVLLIIIHKKKNVCVFTASKIPIFAWPLKYSKVPRKFKCGFRERERQNLSNHNQLNSI